MGRQSAGQNPFARRLKEARLSRGVSQAALGVSAGLDPSVASTRVNQYERGVHVPNFGTVARLANALAVPPAYMYCESDKIASLIIEVDGLPDAQIDILLEAARSLTETR